jgi:hypothetical protein
MNCLPSRALGLTPGLCDVLLIYFVLCVCHRFVSCTRYYMCLWMVHSWFPLLFGKWKQKIHWRPLCQWSSSWVKYNSKKIHNITLYWTTQIATNNWNNVCSFLPNFPSFSSGSQMSLSCSCPNPSSLCIICIHCWISYSSEYVNQPSITQSTGTWKGYDTLFLLDWCHLSWNPIYVVGA